jgi:hypothetical protein
MALSKRTSPISIVLVRLTARGIDAFGKIATSSRLWGTPLLQLAGSFQLPFPPIQVLLAARTGSVVSNQMTNKEITGISESIARSIGRFMALLPNNDVELRLNRILTEFRTEVLPKSQIIACLRLK